MAERRMFSDKIIDSDAFVTLPATAQMLYFRLNMSADDDGFVNCPKRIQRISGATDADLSILIAERFVLSFDSGVVVIKHWHIHNTIRQDRYKATTYTEEKAILRLKDNGAYSMDIEPATKCQPVTESAQPSDNQESKACYQVGAQYSVLESSEVESRLTQERAREEDQEPGPGDYDTRMLSAIPRPLPPSDLPPGFSKTIHDALMAHPGWKIKPQAYAFGWPNEWRDISPCVKGIPPDDILYAIKAYGDIRAGPPGKYWIKFDVGPRTFFQKHLTRFLPGATPYESLLGDGEDEDEEAKARRLAEECVARGKKEEAK